MTMTGPPVGEMHNVLYVPAEAWMPVRMMWTENEAWRVLVQGEGDDDDHAVLANP